MTRQPLASIPPGPLAPQLLSFLIPGLGQFYLRKPQRAAAFFITFLVCAALIYWSKLGWLWLGLALFNLTAANDAAQLARGKRPNLVAPILASLLIIYSIAWVVTDINLARLLNVSSIGITLREILTPDVLTRAKDEQISRVDIQVPCPATPQPVPTLAPNGPSIVLDKSCANVDDPLTIHGYHFIPDTHGRLTWYSPIGDPYPQRRNGQVIDLVPDANGEFVETITVPSAVPVGSNNGAPLTHEVEAAFAQEKGLPFPSETAILVAAKMVETVSLALIATLVSIIFAVPLSFLAAHNVTNRLPFGSLVYYGMRLFLNVTRAIDPIIWGIVIVVWVGLGPFAGMLALAIHSIAALGKLYSEEVEHIDPGPVEAVTSTGANLLQTIRFAIIPQVVPPFLAYTILRWDINVRSATIVGIVAGGGIGFLLIQWIRLNAFNQYGTAMIAIAIVVGVLDYASGVFRERVLAGATTVETGPPQPFYKSPRSLAIAAIAFLIVAVSWRITEVDFSKLLSPGATLGSVFLDFVRIDVSPEVLGAVSGKMLETIFHALLATTLGGILVIPFAFLAARNLTARNPLARIIYYAVRTIFNVLRSIEALVYGAIFVTWVSIGPFAGMLALAVATFALLGKLFSEAIENIDTGPLEAITATGANRLQTIVFGIIPQIVPPFISYAIYQWDINIRISTIIGFVGGGGIGFLLNNYMGQLQYHKAGTTVLAIVLVVALMDFASARIREKLV